MSWYLKRLLFVTMRVASASVLWILCWKSVTMDFEAPVLFQIWVVVGISHAAMVMTLLLVSDLLMITEKK